MERIEFAGFAWPKREWALPKGNPSKRVRKPRYTSGYYENAPRMAGKGDIGFYWEEGGEPSGRQWTLRVAKMHDTGWYCDNFQEECLHGFVFRLPRGRGFLAGWTMGGQMCASVSREIFDNEAAALLEANWMAEKAAEKMREEDMKFQAEQQIQEKREEIQRIRGTLKRVLGARKRLAMAVPEVCEDLASYVSDQLQEIRKARKRIALLEREPWEAVAW